MADVFKQVSGPEPYRVYQRTAANTASIEIRGELIEPTKGQVQARLARGKEPVNGLNWKSLKTEGQTFKGELDGVPVGGPYTFELRVKDSRKISESYRIHNILVGDLWILAGQSNMDGCGKLVELEPPLKYVNCFYYGDYWGIAEDPLCSLNESIDPVHWSTQDPDERAAAIRFDQAFRETGAGLGVRFGKDMYKATGVPVGLLMCSHGGTSMEQWSPKLKNKGGDSLYGCMLRRVQAVGGKVAGCLWYQGESDALSEGVKVYRSVFKKFIESVRADLGRPDLPFIYVQLGPFFTWDPVADSWNQVQEDQRIIESELSNVAFAAAIDCSVSDAIHIDSTSQRRLGARLAKLARRIAFGEKLETGPRPGEIEFTDKDRICLNVRFNGVNGSLIPAQSIRGFRIEKDNIPLEITVCKLGIDGKSVEIRLAAPAPEGAVLWYGWGLNPVCNLRDKLDFALPVFGPIKLQT